MTNPYGELSKGVRFGNWKTEHTEHENRIQLKHLTMTAIPLRSELTLAAVVDALGTVLVLISLVNIRSGGTRSARLATWIILVCNP